jgi:folate-binding protein YgfZ
MTPLLLHDLHARANAQFTTVRDAEVVAHYGDWRREYAALRENAGVMDLSFRSRLVLAGEDRVRFLNGQITNNLKDLPEHDGCYAALVTNKGKMQSDLNVYVLPGEILLDFEPGLGSAIQQRLENYIIADDVQVVDAAPHYGLLSAQGPRAWNVVEGLRLGIPQPARPFQASKVTDPVLGEVYCVNQPRLGTAGFDLFVPVDALEAAFGRLVDAAQDIGGRPCGWQALEVARIEAGIPRFGAEMDETNLPPEAGIESRAISYTKGCYIGQEIIARLRTYGQVAKALRPLVFEMVDESLPERGDKLVFDEKEVGYVTSAVLSPAFHKAIGFGYVRREHNRPGTELRVRRERGEPGARIVSLPDWS